MKQHPEMTNRFNWCPVQGKRKLHLVRHQGATNLKSLCGLTLGIGDPVPDPEEERCCQKCAHELRMIRAACGMGRD